MSNIMNAILAMDVYNRGYHEGIFGLSGAVGSKIGNAVVTVAVDETDTLSRSAGFYAAAYNLSGETVISYRGTDAYLWTESGSIFAWDGDIARGWLVGGGVNNTPWVNQATLAIQFYQSVTEKSVHDLTTPSGVSITGHSLGGGLAGFVASMSGVQAHVYDNMPFGLAAYVHVDHDAKIIAGDDYDLASLGMRAPTLGNVQASFVDGEVLEMVRGYIGPGGAGLLQFLGDIFQPGNWMLNIIQAQYNSITTTATALSLENMVAKTEIPNLTEGLGMTDLHSMALLVAMEYGKAEWDWDGEQGAWRDGAKFVLSNVMNDEIGTALGRVKGTSETTATGNAEAGGQMATMIAYTAIEEGEQPFGNVAIKAMFDDMDDLGTAVRSLGSSNSWFNSHADDLGKIVVNFAGRMAVGKVAIEESEDEEWSEDDWENWDPNALQEDEGVDLLSGVITHLGYFDFNTFGDVTTGIKIDTSRLLWDQGLFARSSDGLSQLEALVSSDNKQIVGLSKFHSEAVDDAMTAGISLLSGMALQYGVTDSQFLGSYAFDSYTFVLGGGAFTLIEQTEGVAFTKIVGDAGYTMGSAGSDVMQAWSEGSTIYGMGGKDILVGGNGADTLVGGAGARIFGGGGNDVLGAEMGYTVGDDASAFIDGGDGYDILQYGGAGDGIVVDAMNSTVTIGSRVDTYAGIERIEGGYGNNVFNGNGQMQFEGSIGDDTFNLKIGDWARGASAMGGTGGAGIDVVSFEGVVGGISMSAGGIVRNAVPGTAFSRVNDVNVIIGTSEADHFTGQGFDRFYSETVRFDGGIGADTFDLYDLNSASGGEGADQFYVHLATSAATTVRITDFRAEDSLMVVYGGTTYQLSGNTLSVSFRTAASGSAGSYDLLEKVTGSSPFSANMPERYIGHYDADDQIYLKSEATEHAPLSGQHDFFEFDSNSGSGVLNLKIAGYGELKVLFDDVDIDDFGLTYDTLPGANGTRYAGQAFNHANPTASYSVEGVSFDDQLYGHMVSTAYINQMADSFGMF